MCAMLWLKPLLRLTMTVTLVVTAVSLLPTAARAHAGHGHDVRPAVRVALPIVAPERAATN